MNRRRPETKKISNYDNNPQVSRLPLKENAIWESPKSPPQGVAHLASCAETWENGVSAADIDSEDSDQNKTEPELHRLPPNFPNEVQPLSNAEICDLRNLLATRMIQQSTERTASQLRRYAVTPCRYHASHNCRFGQSCWFSHQMQQAEEHSKRTDKIEPEDVTANTPSMLPKTPTVNADESRRQAEVQIRESTAPRSQANDREDEQECTARRQQSPGGPPSNTASTASRQKINAINDRIREADIQIGHANKRIQAAQDRIRRADAQIQVINAKIKATNLRLLASHSEGTMPNSDQSDMKLKKVESAGSTHEDTTSAEDTARRLQPTEGLSSFPACFTDSCVHNYKCTAQLVV